MGTLLGHLDMQSNPCKERTRAVPKRNRRGDQFTRAAEMAAETAGMLRHGTCTLTRRANSKRAASPPERALSHLGSPVASPPARSATESPTTAKTAALEMLGQTHASLHGRALLWNKEHRPSRPATRASVERASSPTSPKPGLLPLAAQAEVARVASRPTTRLSAASNGSGAGGRTEAVTPVPFRPKYRNEIERSVEVVGWGGKTRQRVVHPHDGGVPDFILARRLTVADSTAMSISLGQDKDAQRNLSPPRNACTGFVAMPTGIVKDRFRKMRNPTVADQHELAQHLTTDWISQTIPRNQQNWGSAHVINSPNAVEWSNEDVMKSQQCKQVPSLP